MSDRADASRDPRFDGMVLLLAMVIVMWGLEIVDALAAGNPLDEYGIEPRDPDGLPAIVSAPFLHVGFGHLIGNTIPFVAMGIVIALQGLRRFALVTVIVGLVSGAGVWITGPDNSIHLGASGLVFGYATYLLTRGFFSRSMWHLGVGVLVLLVYGSTLLFGLVPTPGVSWQGHVFGGVGGIIAARAIHARNAARSAA